VVFPVVKDNVAVVCPANRDTLNPRLGMNFILTFLVQGGQTSAQSPIHLDDVLSVACLSARSFMA